MRAVLLYEANKIAEIAALKARATEKLRGFSTGIGFWGSPGWALGGAAVLGLVEGLISGGAQREGLQLLRTAAAKFRQLPQSAVFFPSDQIWNVESPYPESWSAIRKIEKHEDDRTWFARTFSSDDYKKWYVHNGDDFINIQTDGGVVCVRWSHVASYVPPLRQKAEPARQLAAPPNMATNPPQRPPPPPPSDVRLRGVPLPNPGEYDGQLRGIPYKNMPDGSLKAFTTQGELFFRSWKEFKDRVRS